MIFVDASAMVAILSGEEDWLALSTKIEFAEEALTSPTAVWETVVSLTRSLRIEFETASAMVDEFLSGNAIRTVPVTPEIGALAVEASRRFGRGRHAAALNFGDCFAYACARAHRAPLLYKGEDFARTDIEAA